ncbi:TylF/MycF family methyltransferase [Streptomyces sp. A1-5]|uniref:TylF/MycF family methyltransferase n=1 Tax=Streptomyces sp. A1-5 TaxID=2738410 RepID=UPI001F3C4432|nr:TylF/MycF family methyltransferase [Streptomyces sp. A1-5]UJB43718.1 class I SAM-dependent methyltransferase [Streptomyces sp. A1-5]
MQSYELYADLMKKVLANVIYEDRPTFPFGMNVLDKAQADTMRPGAEGSAEKRGAFDVDHRAAGLDVPSVAHTMIGMRRLDNIQECVEQVLRDGVPGDFIETGVWRGGACILMRALLKAHGVEDRNVWLADSFAGVPVTSDDSHPLDRGMEFHNLNWVLSCSEEQVRENFARYDLLDDQVKFLPGMFADTLPSAPIEKLAILRMDGDLYESTMDALVNMYPKLSVGGFAIIDDYAIPACKQAVHDYRSEHGIDEPIETVDVTGVYWRRKH